MAEPNVALNNPAPGGMTREQDLIARVQRGQNELFYELVRPYERRVYAAAFAILRNETDAEDVAQEAMLKAFVNIRQFRAEARFSTWLIQITVNEALMRRRRERTVVMEGIDGHRPVGAKKSPITRHETLPIGVKFRLKRWSAKKCGRSWRRLWHRSTANIAKCSCCGIWSS